MRVIRDSNLDLLDSITALMDSEYSADDDLGNGHVDFGFAFNDSNFSDRILRIEILSEPLESRPDGEGCAILADWATNRKRRREDIKENVFTPIVQEQISKQPDHIPDDGENQDEGTAVMIEESTSVECTNDNDSDCSIVASVNTVYISSVILAARSPFFYKLFSNGMRESEQCNINLRINASEEAALMELLKFMYSNTLTVTTAPDLLDVLMAADKFQVASCMRLCSRLLRNLPMTPESALLYLDLPESVSIAEAVQPLTDAAKQFLAARYKDITKFEDEALNLPLAGLEVILSSDDLHVASEDEVYDFVLKWARSHYSRIEERREILRTRLAHFIRFPYLTCRKLRKVLTCDDFDHDFAQRAVMDALFYKAEAPHRQRTYISDENRWFVQRAYKYRPVKVVEFEHPHPQCVVYLDLKRDECASLFPSGLVYSQAFYVGGQGFFLSAHCIMDQQSSVHSFGLFVGMQERESVSYVVDYEFAARSKPAEDFVSKYKGSCTLTGGKNVGYRNLFRIPWLSFIGEDSIYFIDGVLHLRAELTIRHIEN